MKADSLHMGKVFSSGGDTHFMLPHFQREYAWEREDWQILLKDIFAVYDVYNEIEPPEHFMGALVVINDGTRAGTVPVFRLVDGQQRLITFSLMLCALHNVISDEENMIGLRRKLRGYLVNQYESGDLYYKLLPTLKYGDRESYCAIVDGKTVSHVESKIPHAYDYIYKQLHSRRSNGDFEPQQLFNVLVTSLQVVFINLDRREKPYEIFESLNAKGKPLTQADLVRNYIAMKLPAKRQEVVFTELWSPIEEMLLEKRQVGRSKMGELTAFLRHYFAYLSGVLINKEHVYSRFRDRGETLDVIEFEEEVKKLKRFAFFYDRLLRPANEPDNEVAIQLQRLNTMESSTAYPFLLMLYDVWQRGSISRLEMLEALFLIERYLVRRFLAKDTTNYNRFFPPLVKEVDEDVLVKSLYEVLGSKREPSDTRLRQMAERASLYRNSTFVRQRLTLVLETINRHLSRESGAYTVLDAAATIEHVMPQTLTAVWKKHLGNSWEADYELLDTLGNLTLVTQGWNSILSNAPYEKKLSVLRRHDLKLNQAYFREDAPSTWDGEAIRQRAQWLMALATDIWPQIGETAAGGDEVPKQIVIMGESIPVQSWRDVLRRTAESVAFLLDGEFEEKVISKIPTNFTKEPGSHRWHELPNGWHVYYNLNADSIRTLCDDMVEAAEIPEDEYEIVLW